MEREGEIFFLSPQVYMEDSLGDRIWVDLEACKKLVDNIGTLFQTKPYTPGGGSNSGAAGTGTGIGTVSSTSGSDSSVPSRSSSGEGGGHGEAGGEGGGGGGGEGRHGEELSLADIEVAPRLVTSTLIIKKNCQN